MDTAELLARVVLDEVHGTELGHCARIDFFSRAEAVAVCRALLGRQVGTDAETLTVRVLAASTGEGDLFITTDEAIEIRNRKQTRLCLFVPSDTIDAAYSSLANSFAPLDGRALNASAVHRLMEQLPGEASRLVRKVRAVLRRPLQIGDDQLLDFVAAVLTLAKDDALDQAGLALWRVGLIADARSDITPHLDANRRNTLLLTRPAQLTATLRERVAAMGVDTATADALGAFFTGRAMYDVRAWSHALADGQGPTFDRWVFPQQDRSDIRTVTVRPFVNAEGTVERYTKLQQPDGPSGTLQAVCGPKGALTVHWTTDPPKPDNLAHWRVDIVPSDEEGTDDEDDVELPSREVPGSRRSVTLKLDLDLEALPPDFVCVQVTALDGSGNVIVTAESNDPIVARSDEFLLRDIEVAPQPASVSRRTVPSIAFGRLETALEPRRMDLAETQPLWSSKDLDYFSLRLDGRRLLNVGLSKTLHALERRSLAEPRSGGCYIVESAEVEAAPASAVQTVTLAIVDATWDAFWRQREGLFARLRKPESRNVIEAADWTGSAELGNAALRYAQAYRELLDTLMAQGAPREALMQALSLDTLLVRLSTGAGKREDALVVLPTHPLRVAWTAGYAGLLRSWEARVLELGLSARRQAVDLRALQSLAPTNVPAFASHVAAGTREPFVFYQNLRFFHGVFLPAGTRDPRRHYDDVATVLGTGTERCLDDEMQPERLAEHLARFRQLHPYADSLVTTLINPDRGDLFANALERLASDREPDDADARRAMPTFHVTAFIEDPTKSTVEDLARIRQLQVDDARAGRTDVFAPGLDTVLRDVKDLDASPPPEAHIAIISDFTRPTVITLANSIKDEGQPGSLSLYGLVVRFMPRLVAPDDNLRWHYSIVIEGRTEPHPAGPRYSETLTDLHAALLRAGGHAVTGVTGMWPALEVVLSPERRRLLRDLHARTDWVVTLDRFFGLDYYDSPHLPSLADVARTYLIDYTPEFAEGLGHRLVVTTAWREEIESLLHQAMDDLGFSAVDQSVGQLLHYLKTVSGRLALQVMQSSSSAAAAVGLGVVTAWLQRQGRLATAVLVPVDLHPRLFSPHGSGAPALGERRCDLVLISLKRNIVEATFIEVKWRRGLVDIHELAQDMVVQMQDSARAMEMRFFNDERIDGALQRAYLANVLRFYFERARRYGTFDPEAEDAFLDHLARLEKTRLDFRPGFEGYIVSLDQAPQKPFMEGDAKITILTAPDFSSTLNVVALESPLTTGTIIDTGPAKGSRDTSFADGDTAVVDGPDEAEALRSVDQVTVTTEQSSSSTDSSAGDVLASNLIIEDNNEFGEDDEEAVPDDEEVDIDAGPQGEVVVPLGNASGGEVAWRPSVRGSPHLFIAGIPGQGKSWAVLRILSLLARQRVPALVLDFHGQFSDQDSSFVRTMRPTILDAARGLPFSPFECSLDGSAADWKANCFAIAEIFGYVAGLGAMQRDAVYTAVRDAYQAQGFTDGGDTAALEYPTLRDVQVRLEARERMRQITNVSARCRPLLEMDLFRPTAHDASLLSTIRAGAVIDLHHLYAETLQLATGAFVLRKLYKDMFHWGQADRLRLVLVLDEAHRLARDITLPKIMKEGRKFGIAVIVASQGLSDFHQDVLGNAGTKVVFRTNYPDSRRISGFIRARSGQDLVTRIEGLPVGSAYVQTPEMTFGEAVRMYPLEAGE